MKPLLVGDRLLADLVGRDVAITRGLRLLCSDRDLDSFVEHLGRRSAMAE